MTPYYERNGVTIFCGDCLEVMPQLDGPVDCVITDPPYSINYSPSQNGSTAWGKKNFVGKTVVANDDKPFDPAPFLRYKIVVLFGANHYADKLPSSPNWIVWDKRVDLTSNDFADCELIWTNKKTVARIFRHRWSGAIRDSEHNDYYHPTQKPIVLMVYLILQYTDIDDIIIDPFMGSGTTLVAAQNEGRRAIGIELSEDYCKIAVERLRQPSLFYSIPEEPKAEPKQAALWGE